MKPDRTTPQIERCAIAETDSIASEGQTFDRIIRLGLYDDCGVNLEMSEILRVFIRRFYFSLPPEQFSEGIDLRVNRAEAKVAVTGPVAFHLCLPWRVGPSVKTLDAGEFAGGFGNDFAITTLVIMRDHGVGVSLRICGTVLQFFFETVAVGEQTVRELCCGVGAPDVANGGQGTELVLSNCSATVLESFEQAKQLFRYDGNPTFGACLGADPQRGLYCYRSACNKGAVFYRHQKRAGYDLPFIFCHDAELKGVLAERDRRDLDRREVKNVVAKVVEVLDAHTIKFLVKKDLRPFWKKGHPLLAALADRWCSIFARNPRSVISFPEDHLVKCAWSIDDDALGAGKALCHYRLHCFGMPTVVEWKRRLYQAQLREPDEIEEALLSVLLEAYKVLFRFPLKHRTLRVFVPAHDSDECDSALSGTRTLAINENTLREEFADAFAAFLDGEINVCVWEGREVFANQRILTLRQTVKHRHLLDPFEKRWATIQTQRSDDKNSRPRKKPGGLRRDAWDCIARAETSRPHKDGMDENA